MDSPNYTYDQARSLIKSGDLISFFASHEEAFLHRLATVPVLFFTGSGIYHSGIALCMETEFGEKRLMVCEGVGVGRRLVNASHFAEKKMEIQPLPDTCDRQKVVNFMLDGIGTPYAFGTLIVIGAQEFFGKTPSASSGLSQVCSETAALAWQAGGFKFPVTTKMSPGKLRNTLIEMGIPVSIIINPTAGN
jgi:hypothetical protein